MTLKFTWDLRNPVHLPTVAMGNSCNNFKCNMLSICCGRNKCYDRNSRDNLYLKNVLSLFYFFLNILNLTQFFMLFFILLFGISFNKVVIFVFPFYLQRCFQSELRGYIALIIFRIQWAMFAFVNTVPNLFLFSKERIWM